MPLAINEKLLASDILQARDLKDGKIFLLKGRHGSQLVIKAEGKVTDEKIRATAPVIKAIDPSVKMKPLLETEVVQLRQFLTNWKDYVALLKRATGEDPDLPISAEEKKCMKALEECLDTYGVCGPGGRTNIAKMSYQQMSTLSVVLDVESKPENDASWDKARGIFAEFVKALNASGGLEKLGQIVAGDFFIGNEDRFVSSIGDGMKLTLYDTDKKLNVIGNLGNVILVKNAKGKSQPSMLDYMDPNTKFLDTTKTLNEIQNNFLVDWPMRRLITKEKRLEFAQALVDDLEYLLKPEKHLFGFNKLGGSRAAKRVDDGIVKGIRAILNSLEATQAKSKNLSTLIQDCYVELKKAKL